MNFWPFHRHRHRYFEVDRQWLEKVWRNIHTGENAPGSSPVTLITERCADKCCGKYRQQTLSGHLLGGHDDPHLTPDGEVVVNE